MCLSALNDEYRHFLLAELGLQLLRGNFTDDTEVNKLRGRLYSLFSGKVKLSLKVGEHD